MHDVGGVFAISPFFCTDGEADAPPGCLAGVAPVGDWARVEGIHDVLVYLSGFVLLTCFTVAQCLALVSTLFFRPAGRCL